MFLKYRMLGVLKGKASASFLLRLHITAYLFLYRDMNISKTFL